MIFNSKEKKILTDQVKTALIEDQVMDDLTCRAIKIQNKSIAKVIFKESGILCGKHWVDEVFKICLLYTSPSPRDGLLSRMPSSA